MPPTGPAHERPVRDQYAAELPGGTRVELRRHGPPLLQLTVWPPDEEPSDFELRRWYSRHWAAQTEDPAYAEGLRGLLVRDDLLAHAEWITGERPTSLSAEAALVVDDLRATWRSRFGASATVTPTGSQSCRLCAGREPTGLPVAQWSHAPAPAPCMHRDAAAEGVRVMAAEHPELVFELLDLIVVAQLARAANVAPLRHFVLLPEWMRAVLGHWLLGDDYVHHDRPWKFRSLARHHRFGVRPASAGVRAELSPAEAHAFAAWGVPVDADTAHDDAAQPDASWWTDGSLGAVGGVRVYPEASAPKPPAQRAPSRRAPPEPPAMLRPPPVVDDAPPAPAVPVRRKRVPTPRNVAPSRQRNGELENTVNSLTAGLAALSEMMGRPKGRRG